MKIKKNKMLLIVAAIMFGLSAMVVNAAEETANKEDNGWWSQWKEKWSGKEEAFKNESDRIYFQNNSPVDVILSVTKRVKESDRTESDSRGYNYGSLTELGLIKGNGGAATIDVKGFTGKPNADIQLDVPNDTLISKEGNTKFEWGGSKKEPGASFTKYFEFQKAGKLKLEVKFDKGAGQINMTLSGPEGGSSTGLVEIKK